MPTKIYLGLVLMHFLSSGNCTYSKAFFLEPKSKMKKQTNKQTKNKQKTKKTNKQKKKMKIIKPVCHPWSGRTQELLQRAWNRVIGWLNV